MQVPQKDFHIRAAALILVVEAVRHLGLVFKMQGVAFAARDIMKPVSDPPDVVERPGQGMVFVMGQKSIIFQVPPLFDIGLDFGVP